MNYCTVISHLLTGYIRVPRICCSKQEIQFNIQIRDTRTGPTVNFEYCRRVLWAGADEVSLRGTVEETWTICGKEGAL